MDPTTPTEKFLKMREAGNPAKTSRARPAHVPNGPDRIWCGIRRPQPRQVWRRTEGSRPPGSPVKDPCSKQAEGQSGPSTLSLLPGHPGVSTGAAIVSFLTVRPRPRSSGCAPLRAASTTSAGARDPAAGPSKPTASPIPSRSSAAAAKRGSPWHASRARSPAPHTFAVGRSGLTFRSSRERYSVDFHPHAGGLPSQA